MKKLLSLLIINLALVSVEASVPFLRIGESYPNTYCARIPGSEQITGQQFQQDAIVTYNGYQYTVYYNDTRNVSIARRKMPLGKWQEVVLPYKNTLNDAHNVISMGICANDGTIHLAYDHHNDDLHYCRSVVGLANEPDKIRWETESFSATTSILVDGVKVVDVTYPRFIPKPDGNLLFECRFHYSGFGDSYLREYDGETHTWSLIGRYVQGLDTTPDACAYINGMTYDNQDRIHVTWCWRDEFGGGSNHDFYYAYSEDHGRTWKDNTGTQVAITEYMEPVVIRETGNCLGQTKSSLMIEAIPYNRGYINQETQATDSKGRIHAVNSHMPDGVADDSNWSSSRTKARLHHRFRDTDGTWKKRLIKDNAGNTVHSYCRVHLAFDAADNAYVVANGAEIYVATPENDYDDWTLLTNVDKGRFISEPHVDRRLLLSEGILSYVYLADNQSMVVVDYLLDNPNTPAGTGLFAEYYSDKTFETLISSDDKVNVTASNAPSGTNSIRWSGTFETLYAEEYTLYLTTSEQITVEVDNKTLLMTEKTTQPQEYEIKFPAIASHKHNLVIEMVGTNTSDVSLKWSSARTVKAELPLNVLYPVIANTSEPVVEPQLNGRETLMTLLSENINIKAESDASIITLPFNPQGDYSIDVKARINNAEGRGLDIDARASNGNGFRTSMNKTELNWTVPLESPMQLFVSDNSKDVTLRFAVQNDKVHIYRNTEYIATWATKTIGDISGNSEQTPQGTYGSELLDGWSGPAGSTGKPTDYGWVVTPAGKITIADANTSVAGSVRFMDVTHNLVSGGSYTGRLLTPRWDNDNWSDICYSYPVALEANTTYNFSMLYELWGSASGVQQISVVASKNADGAGEVGSKSFATSSSAMTLSTGEFTFTTKEAGTYYLTFKGARAMFGIGALSLKKYSIDARLILGKNYTGGSADMKILSVRYEDGAYAPKFPDGEEEPELEVKKELDIRLLNSTQLNVEDGTKSIATLAIDPQGDYSVEVSATVTTAVGRGLDIEARAEDGVGFRTSLGTDNLMFISPFNEPSLISALETKKQVIRYAVKSNDKVYVYRDDSYLGAYPLAVVGNMNEAGTAEISPFDKLIENGDFKQTLNNEAPAGWLSDKAMGGGVAPRVQVGNAEIPGATDDPSLAAFVIKFDANGGTWYSYPVTLQPATEYELSFDLIAWGTNTDKSFNVVISTSRDGGSGVLKEDIATTPSVRATSAQKMMSFTTPAGNENIQYYVSFTKKEEFTNAGITNVALTNKSQTGTGNLNRLLYGKNYLSGVANILIDYISYDDTGAYAPDSDVVEVLSENSDDDIPYAIYASNGMLCISQLNDAASVMVCDLTGRVVYEKMVDGQATVAVPVGQGMYVVRVKTGDGVYGEVVFVGE